VRYLEDGNIEYIGRIDEQVKIRGHRIELGEIERCLLDITFVENAVVILNSEDNNINLVGYITVLRDDITSSVIKRRLSTILPQYMVPNYIVVLENIPTTINGKVDKNFLQSLKLKHHQSTEYLEPSTDTEKKIIILFKELLNKSNIGINHNFFELGGDSLLATQLISRIKYEFNIQLQLKDFFELDTIRSLSITIDSILSKEPKDIDYSEEEII
jgi:acyl carrier protein